MQDCKCGTVMRDWKMQDWKTQDWKMRDQMSTEEWVNCSDGGQQTADRVQLITGEHVRLTQLPTRTALPTLSTNTKTAIVKPYLGPILPRFKDIAGFLLKRPTPPLFHTIFVVFPLD